MKITTYRFLFRFVSFMSDKTGGLPLFVKYKLLLGTIIIGLGGSSCAGKTRATCYDYTPIDDDNSQIMCYEPIAPRDTVVEDSLQITCYETIELPAEPTKEK